MAAQGGHEANIAYPGHWRTFPRNALKPAGMTYFSEFRKRLGAGYLPAAFPHGAAFRTPLADHSPAILGLLESKQAGRVGLRL